jgi:hypothetical protein
MSAVAQDIQPGDSIIVQVSDTLTLTGVYLSFNYDTGLLLIRVQGDLHVIKEYHYFTKTVAP